MRNKDAIDVAKILGTELRLCQSSEEIGLLAALGAVAGHMSHLYADAFDLIAYQLAASHAAGYRVRWDGLP